MMKCIDFIDMKSTSQIYRICRESCVGHNGRIWRLTELVEVGGCKNGELMLVMGHRRRDCVG